MMRFGPGRRLAVALVATATATAVVIPGSGRAGASLPASGVGVASSGTTFTHTETITRDHLVHGADDVVDTRKVTLSVDQTSALRERQEITVSWSGAHPTGGLASDQNSQLAAEQEYPVVLMECRGVDSPTAPPSQQLAPQTCWTHTPEERFQSNQQFNFPPYRVDRYATAADRAFTVGAPSPVPAACTSGGSGAQHWVPFAAANGTVYAGGPPAVINGTLQACGGIPPEAVNVEESLQPSNTTYAASDLHGNGSAKFTVSTGETNASLGCSDTTPCSLVVIPIMGISCDTAAAGLPPEDQPTPQSVADAAFSLCSATGKYHPGDLSNGTINQEDLAVSGDLWWSMSNWRNRISVPLNFAPAADACSLVNTSTPLYLYGSELMTQATAQWSPAFCLNTNLFKIQHVQTSEPEAKNLLQTGGIEAAIQGAPPQNPFTNPVVQAPIGLTGFAVSYAIDDGSTQPYQDLKLTPRLLAKLLTESYPAVPAIRDADLPLAHNPLNLAADPEFEALNPGIPFPAFYSIPAATLFTVSSDSDVIWALTSYINSDPAARAWLNGAPDPWGMVVNPAYKHIALPVTGWPLLDTFHSGPAYDPNFDPCLAADTNHPVPFLPLVAAPVSTMAAVTINMQFGIANSQTQCFDPGAQDQKLVAVGREAPGQQFLIGVTPLADAARYQLNTAALQTQVSPSAPAKFTTSTGRTFVAPSGTSLKAAAALLQPDKTAGSWVLPYGQFQTSANAAGAYPGTMLMSADVPTIGLPKVDAQRYATFLNFAAGTGQTPGAGNGQLPPGYLPMTAANGMAGLVGYTQRAAAAVAAQHGALPPLVAPNAGPTSNPAGSPPSTGQQSTTTPASTTAAGPAGGTNSSGSASAGGAGRGGAARGPYGTTARSAPAGGKAESASLGRTLAVGAGLGGLALPLALLLALIGGVSVPLTSWLRKNRTRK